MPDEEYDQSAGGMIRNYDEAVEWLEGADLRSTTLVLEDHFNGEHVATALIGGGEEAYNLMITEHEGEEDVTVEKTVDRDEVAEMMGGWTVAGRKDV